jgi:heterodisulfide reductase subunit A2
VQRDVLVIGGGIAGMQTALVLAEKDRHVYVVDSAPAVGGFFPLLDRQFPTNSCGVCFMSPKPRAVCPMYETDFHRDIELLTNSEVTSVDGKAGNFKVTVGHKPTRVHAGKCTLCGKCEPVCPVEVDRKLGAGVEKRKAIYMPFPRAVPRSYVIDEEACTKCGACVEACPENAVDLGEAASEKVLNVGAVVLAFGFEPFEAKRKGEFGLGRYGNVLTGIQYERMLSYSSPGEGVPQRPSDGKRPRKVAFIQCVGSRDMACDAGYCSSVCCMYATKQAIVSTDRVKGLNATVFYMDMRAVGKNYEHYYNLAKSEHGVRYLRSSISTVRELKRSGNLLIEYGTDDGQRKAEEFDMVVLSVGFSAPAAVKELAGRMGVDLNEFGFCATSEFKPTETSVPGVFVAGAFRGPRDIPETVVDGCSAAADVSSLLDSFEDKQADQPAKPSEDLSSEFVPRVGVFLCELKGKLSGALDLDALAKGAGAERGVVCVERVDVGDIWAALKTVDSKARDEQLNRVVLAGYRAMEMTRAARTEAAVGPYVGVFESVNIGTQCAEAHSNEPELANAKAEEMIRAGVRKALLATPRKFVEREISTRTLVLGGGISGLTASLALAEQDLDVTLVEKSGKLGGNARFSHYTAGGGDIPALVAEKAAAVESNSRIEVLKNAQLTGLEGSWGSYRAKVSVDGQEREVLHGALIVATGAQQATTGQYLFGKSPRIVAQRTLEGMLARDDQKALSARNIVMINCAGSRETGRPWCSRVCCVHSIKNVLMIKEKNPDAQIYVLYRDMRTYGFYEKLYQQARAKGVVFVRYSLDDKPEVALEGEGVKVSFVDELVGERIEISADLLVLGTGIDPADSKELAATANLQLTPNGFFAEANPKAAPLDAADLGKFIVGLCNAPMHIEEAICQAKAAAARASALLWSGAEYRPEARSQVNAVICAGCGACVSVCPYDAITLDPEKKHAVIDEARCQGCGICAATCRSSAIDLDGFSNEQVLSVLSAL